MKAFVSHNSGDKPFVRRLAQALQAQGVECWVDEAEIRFGESLIQKISQAIEELDVVIAVISARSVDSDWVRKELSLALTKEIESRRVVVIPVLISRCDIPFFLRDKLYADFTDLGEFSANARKLVESIEYHTGRQPTDAGDRVPGEGITARYRPTLLAFVSSGLLVLLAVGIMGAVLVYGASDEAWPGYRGFQQRALLFCILLIVLQVIEVIQALLKRSVMRTNPNFANDVGDLVITGLLSRRYRAVLRRYWPNNLLKVATFCEIGVYICLPPMALLVLQVAIDLFGRK